MIISQATVNLDTVNPKALGALNTMEPSGSHSDVASSLSNPNQYEEIQAPQQQHQRPQMNERNNSRAFEELRNEDREELARIASNFPRQLTADSGTSGEALKKKETTGSINLDDPALDPTSDKFDHYKWSRMMLKLMDRQGIPRPPSTGVVFQNLNISGSGAELQYQNCVPDLLLAPFRPQDYFSIGKSPVKRILRDFNGLLKSGELLIVLGRPGSGCSTFLKSICGELHGLKLRKSSEMQYNGISMERMHTEFKGETLYNQEVDKHFPHLTVGETLEFAAAARTPEHRLHGVNRRTFAKHITKVAMAIFGLSHTYNTKGNSFLLPSPGSSSAYH